MTIYTIPHVRGGILNTIMMFDGPHEFLNNFYESDGPQVILPAEEGVDGRMLGALPCRSVEHAYQAWKTLVWEERLVVVGARHAGQSRRLGQKVTLRPDFSSTTQVAIMLLLQRQKYALAHPQLRQWLLDTGDAVLMEGNTWGDIFFGVNFNPAAREDGKTGGENHLGQLLMQVRAEIRAGKY